MSRIIYTKQSIDTSQLPTLIAKDFAYFMPNPQNGDIFRSDVYPSASGGLWDVGIRFFTEWTIPYPIKSAKLRLTGNGWSSPAVLINNVRNSTATDRTWSQCFNGVGTINLGDGLYISATDAQYYKWFTFNSNFITEINKTLKIKLIMYNNQENLPSAMSNIYLQVTY